MLGLNSLNRHHPANTVCDLSPEIIRRYMNRHQALLDQEPCQLIGKCLGGPFTSLCNAFLPRNQGGLDREHAAIGEANPLDLH
ncbi:hypothetical protein [Cupriavidus sp. EM10]|uniref:hypothetical protein n=1 Tax=Cupriavidus sp. EM10 TaxID=2839983 RepID=UPI001BFFEA11|nr:hypothetical protein [Cupriavidus sp. EM10]QWE98207.1 hypothetical protein KLP38_28955 [Cupriavidus sp. EM10]